MLFFWIRSPRILAENLPVDQQSQPDRCPRQEGAPRMGRLKRKLPPPEIHAPKFNIPVVVGLKDLFRFKPPENLGIEMIEMIQFDEHILQMGWNHQLVNILLMKKSGDMNIPLFTGMYTRWCRISSINSPLEAFPFGMAYFQGENC